MFALSVTLCCHFGLHFAVVRKKLACRFLRGAERKNESWVVQTRPSIVEGRPRAKLQFSPPTNPEWSMWGLLRAGSGILSMLIARQMMN